MKIITVRDLPFEGECVVSIGNFDGVHLGHASLLEKASEIAKENKLPMVVFTLRTPPKTTALSISPVRRTNLDSLKFTAPTAFISRTLTPAAT